MERLYRDPVHNIITLSEHRSDDALLIELIDTPEFQRLRHIKQLGLALYTFQGAEHSRFTHSLGVMHLMTRVLDQLAKRHRITPEERIAARVAALLHDIGHGPFSHVIEKVLHQHHERWSVRIIANRRTAINQRLRQYAADLPERVIALIEHRFEPSWVGQLVSSQLDVDRFDYLLRDSLMTGVKYGNYDLEWILHALEIDTVTGQLYVGARGLYAVEEYLQARFYMFRQVYFHRTLRAAEAVLISILRRAVDLWRAGRLDFVLPGSVMARLLAGEPLKTAEYLRFDDHDVMFHLKQWTTESDKILRDLSRRFIERRLFKAIDLPADQRERADSIATARNVVSRLGYDPDYYLIEDRTGDVPFYNYYQAESQPESTPAAMTESPAASSGAGRASGARRLLIEAPDRRGQLVDIAEVSAVVRGMRGYELHRLCFPAEAAAAIAAERP
ncbi:MAG: HD domain-containing protein [Acidobacteriota bacterium]